jgi:hypothetical protein
MKTIPADTLRAAISTDFLNPFAVPNGGTPMVDNVTLFTPDEYLRRGKAGKFAKVVRTQQVLVFNVYVNRDFSSLSLWG